MTSEKSGHWPVPWSTWQLKPKHEMAQLSFYVTTTELELVVTIPQLATISNNYKLIKNLNHQMIHNYLYIYARARTRTHIHIYKTSFRTLAVISLTGVPQAPVVCM